MALFAEGLTAQVSARFSLSGLQFNVCGTMPICGTLDGKLASGCEAETETKELKNLRPGRLVGLEKILQLSPEGFITLTYTGLPSHPKGEPRSLLFLQLTSVPAALCVHL